jgi:hypothetical protein
VKSGNIRIKRLILTLGLLTFAGNAAIAAEVFKGTAKFTDSKDERTSTTVTISLDGRTTDADQAALREKAQGKPGGAKELLAALPELGYIQAVDRKVPIRYAYIRPAGSGQMMTLISDQPLGYVGSNKKYVKSKEGYDLTYVMVAVDGSGKGRGEMAPACKIKFMDSGAPAVEDYGGQVVWLDDVVKATESAKP